MLTGVQAKKKIISYIESDSEGTDNDDVFKPTPANRGRAVKRRKLSDEEDEDVYEQENVVDLDEGKFSLYLLRSASNDNTFRSR